MLIGVPKEQVGGETRVAITPDIIKKLITKGFSFAVEADAGLKAGFENEAYIEAGAELVDCETAFAAPVVAKVRKPSAAEVKSLKDGSIYIGFVETCDDDDIIHAMHEKNITILAMERIPRISRAQSMDALSSQSNIAGYRAVIEAASHYGRFLPMMMTAAGSAKPSRVVILGVGVAGLQAIATARRLGADVYAYDVRPETKEQIESLGAKAIEFDLGESGSGEGGYAKELSDEAKQKQQQMLADELSKAHVIVTTALIPCRPAPVLITEEVVKNMRAGSVIVDLAASNGGNCPISEADKVVTKHHVTLVGHTNYPAMLPADASNFYAGNIQNLLNIMVEKIEGDDSLKLKNLDDDEITQIAQLRHEK